MATDRRSSDPADPLLGYSGLSLFPRTFRDSSTFSKPSGHDSIESLHSYLKSRVLRSPTKLLEQAKSILDGGSELLTNFPSHVASEDKRGPISEKWKENPLERRPALGRKRARFSLKPDSSQPTMVLEPSLDIDKLQDPEEYFLAHEKLENAKKELQRQQGGVLMDLNQHNPLTTARHRRPGILGRSVSYKHHYSSLVSDNDENLIPSPATVEQEIVSPNYSSRVEMVDPNVALQERELTEMMDPNVDSQERELTVSVTKAENKVDELLDELLSGNCEDLDGDGTLTFLQERLQIKPIDLDKLCLPELHDIQRNDSKSSGANWLRHRDSLSDIKTMLKGLSSKTPIKNGQVPESSVHPLASPTPPKSPFASISLLKRHILQSNLTSDPFSVLKVNLSPARNSSSVKCSDKQSDKIDSGKELSFSAKLKSVILEGDDIAVANKGSHEGVPVITGDSTPPSEIAVNNDMRRLGVDINSGLSGSHADLDGNIRSNNVDDDLRRPDADTDVRINGTKELEDKVEDMLQEAEPHADPDQTIEDSTLEKLNSGESQWDQPTPAVVEDCDRDGPSKTADNDPEKRTEQKILKPSDESLNKRSKAKTPPRRERKRKEISRRQSLAEAGTLWSSGVRRSTRIKMRPLEYWKGERFLYGRIHQSLTTVIGVKYVSPAKGGGKPAIKVKSYVSDEYKELVDLAALH